MSWRSPRLWIAVLTSALVLAMAVADLGRSAPGPIAEVHGRLAAIDGGQSCRQCHGGLFTSMTESCLECHAPIAAQLASGSGVHGQLGKARASQCALCHSEHHGTDFALVNAMSFAQAGAGDAADFDHDRIGFAMRGRHLELACDACHLLANVPVLREGERRYLGLSQDCAACHHDPHGGRMQLACTACHEQESFHGLAALDHDRVLPLTGGHADVACATCHDPAGPHSLDAVGGAHAPAARACADCHASPHTGEFVAATAAASDVTTRAACVACHLAAHGGFADAAPLLRPEQHAHSGFVLAPPHDQATCEQCHPPSPAFAARHPGRKQDDCRACHDDPHGGQFDADPLAAQGCVSCHTRTTFAPHTFTPEVHAQAGLALTHSHLEVDCHRCHLQPSAGEPRTFRGTSTQCDGCHTDAHDGFFDAAAAAQPRPTHGLCAHCHLPTSFATPAPGFDHGAWTGFALTGSHEQAACASCHRSTAKDAAGRSFGRVADTFAPRAGCARCHVDPHGGLFDAPTLPARIHSREGCARCHTETSFRATEGTFDHAQWTGFALGGSHAKVACAQCHAPLAQADEHGRTAARAKGRACADCHADPHGGQFDHGSAADCARCHQPVAFKALTFKHNLDARFVLGEAHAGVACSACHKRERIGGEERVRYRPLPRKCVDCHGAHEEQLRRRKGKGS